MDEEKQKGAKPEKTKELPDIADFPILTQLLEGGGEVVSEYELERRFLPARLLTKEELAALPMRRISQRFVTVKDKRGIPTPFRLRITHQKGEEGLKYRIARKQPAGKSFGKLETQIAFRPDLDDERTQQFHALWNQKDERIIERERYYFEHPLPNGSTCDIHYEVWKGEEDDGFVRIEVEFRSESADVDQRYFEDHPDILPDWVGTDITFDSRYRVKNINKDGIPKDGRDHVRSLRGKA